MSEARFRVIIEGDDGNVFDKITADVDNSAQHVNEFNKTVNKLGGAFFAFNQISQGVQTMNRDFQEAIEPGLKLQSSMKELEAVTGASGEALKLIEENGRASAKVFGVDASKSIEGYKLLLSQLTPEIAKNPEALKLMGDSASLFSKQLKGDVSAATEIATTAMNAFGVSMDDPIAAAGEMRRMMDEMTQGAKAGSAELPAIKEAMSAIGASAKNANVTFAETNAAIQVLDKNALKGAQGGTALRNVLSKLNEGRFMSKESLDALKIAGVDINVLMDKSKSLATRMDELKKIQGDTALVTQFFGRENANAGVALIQNTDLLRDYTTQIQDSEGATEQFANTVMSSTEEKIARMKAWVADWGISLQKMSEPVQPFLSIGGSALEKVADLGLAVQAFSVIGETKFIKSIGSMGLATKAFTAIQWLMNAAFVASPIGWIALGLAGATAAVIYAWNHFEGFRKFIYAMGETIMTVFGNIIDFFKNLFAPVIEAIQAIMDGDFSKAALAIGKALVNAVTAPIQFVVAGATGELTKGVDDAIALGKQKGSDQAREAAKAQAGTTVAGAPDGNPFSLLNPQGTFGADQKGGAPSAISAGLNSVSGGTAKGEGVKNIRFEVNGGLVHTINIYAGNIREAASQVREHVERAIVDGLRDGEIAVSGS